jgi:heme A synthase
MIDSSMIDRFPSPRLRRFAAAGTLALLFALLVLGTIVTSFRVGMADPIWPTRPWHLLTISWEEPSAGYLIEHTHRAAGFIVGLAVTLLAMLLWLTETRRFLRWAGPAAIVVLVGLFMGHLHGTLIAQQRAFQAAGELTTPDWTIVLGPTLAALALTTLLAVWSAATGPNGATRLLGVVLLVAVMTQGVLGGLRVYLNALWGTDLAATHGVFSQIVMAIAVATVIFAAPRRNPPADDRWLPDSKLVRVGLIAAVLLFGEIVAGAVLRHTDSSLGPRLHLIGAFLVVFAVGAVSRRSPGSPRGFRVLAILASALAGLQILLGVEAWMVRFKAGMALSALQQITVPQAVVRTLHALVGYGLFASVIALTILLLRHRQPAARLAVARRPELPAEAVA